MYENSDSRSFGQNASSFIMDLKGNNNVKEKSSPGYSAFLLDQAENSDKENSMDSTVDLERSSSPEDGQFGIVPSEDETPLFVTCGSNKAVLYLERLEKGSKGASILFEDWWLTPNEFQKISGRGTAKDWKRSIKHHGRSLKLLMAKGLLFLSPPVCKCEYCLSDKATEGEGKTTDDATSKDHESVAETSKSPEVTVVEWQGGSGITSSETVVIKKEENLIFQAGDTVLQEDVYQSADMSKTESKRTGDSVLVENIDPNVKCENMETYVENETLLSVEIKKEEGDSCPAKVEIPCEVTVEFPCDILKDKKDIFNETVAVEKSEKDIFNLMGSDAAQGQTCEKLADDNDTDGAKMAGNHPGADDMACSWEIATAAVKLAITSPGSPPNEGDDHQKPTKTSSVINSGDALDDGPVCENPIREDKFAPNPSSQVTAEAKGEIRPPLKMESTSQTQADEPQATVNSTTETNKPSRQEGDEVDSSFDSPLLNNPTGGNKAKGYMTGEDSPKQCRSPRASETPPCSPVIPATNCIPPACVALGVVPDNATDLKREESPITDNTAMVEENIAMSPQKEARLINIIEELKHYKKCLEVQMEAQKYLVSSQPCSQTTKVLYKAAVSPKMKSPHSYRKRHTSMSDKEDNETTITDHSCHATGTVHWGVPKGYSPSHMSPTSTVMPSYQTLNNNMPTYHMLHKNKVHSSNTADATTMNSYQTHCYQNKSPQNQNDGGGGNCKLKSNSCSESRLPKKIHGISKSPKRQKSMSHKGLNANNNTMIPNVDTNAYFAYLSECLKRGQMPNMYGYFHSVSASKTPLTIPSPKSVTPVHTSPKVAPVSPKRSFEANFDDSGALDLSIKRQKMQQNGLNYPKQSNEIITTDKYGVLDLSKKSPVKI